MSQGITIKGKTATGQLVEALVDNSGKLYLADGGETQTQTDELAILTDIDTALQAIASTKGVAADLRVTVVSGGTIATVTTLSNITSVGGLNATPLPQNTQNQTAVQSNINNIVVS